MKSLVSLAICGLLSVNAIKAQNFEAYAGFASEAELVAASANARGARLLDNTREDGFNTYSWTKDIYRELSNDVKNSLLFMPQISNEDNVNLLSFLVNLAGNNMISTYKYEVSVVAEDPLIPIKEVLDTYRVPYIKGATGNTLSLNVKDVSNITVSFYIREKWYFDTKAQRGGVKIVAVCPVLNGTSKSGQSVKNPLFWVLLDDVAPFLDRAYGDVSSYKTKSGKPVDKISFYDFFVKRLYDGEIYQVGTKKLTDYNAQEKINYIESIEKELAETESIFLKYK